MDRLQKSKLLVVDDSAFMRKLISDFFVGNPKVIVIGTARNGKDAIKKIQQLEPDVVTMDVEMPEMNISRLSRRSSVKTLNLRRTRKRLP